MFYRIWCYRWRDLFKTMPAVTLHCTLGFTFNITFSHLPASTRLRFSFCPSNIVFFCLCLPKGRRKDRSQEFKLALGLQLLCISNSDKSQAAVHKADSVSIPRKAAALLSGLSAATQFGNSAHTRKSSSISQVTGLRASAEITVS